MIFFKRSGHNDKKGIAGHRSGASHKFATVDNALEHGLQSRLKNVELAPLSFLNNLGVDVDAHNVDPAIGGNYCSRQANVA